jgi:hypothetical protein
MKCPRCAKAANVENEMFCAHPLCPLPIPVRHLTANEQQAMQRALKRSVRTIHKAR